MILNNPTGITLLLMLGQLGCLSGCMTLNVNVHFPESAVQKATDDYVRELYRAKEKGRGPTPASSSAPIAEPTKQSRFSFPFIASAMAEDLSFKVETPKALKIRDRLSGRVAEILAQKRAGVLGESSVGTLVLKSPEKLKPILQKKIEKLVADENADRDELYTEVMQANALPKNRQKDIQKSFARSFQAESPSGTWLQDPENGSWTQKP